MAKSRFYNIDVVREALDASPNVSSQALARALYKRHPGMFPSMEAARSSVRRARGACGIKNRNDCKVRNERSNEDANRCERLGAMIPEPEPTSFKWHELPSDVKRWLMFSDVHIPYHDKGAVEAMLKHADGNCDGILILGDLMDCHRVSHFCCDTRKRSIDKERDAVCQFLDVLRELGPKRIIWKAGNHEARMEMYLMQRAPELWPMIADVADFPHVCGLKQRGVKFIRPQDPLSHHALTLIHGHEWGFGYRSSVNPARGAFMRANACMVVGHLHRSSNHPEPNIRGVVTQCWSLGCLCDLHPDYCSVSNKWNHGFAYLNSGSEWNIQNHTIIDGKVF